MIRPAPLHRLRTRAPWARPATDGGTRRGRRRPAMALVGASMLMVVAATAAVGSELPDPPVATAGTAGVGAVDHGGPTPTLEAVAVSFSPPSASQEAATPSPSPSATSTATAAPSPTPDVTTSPTASTEPSPTDATPDATPSAAPDDVADAEPNADATTQVGAWRVSDVQASGDVVMVGADWGGDPAVLVEVRSREDGTWSPWHRLALQPEEGPDSNSAEDVSTASGPVWLGHTDTMQVRTTSTRPEQVELLGVSLEGSLDWQQPDAELETGTAEVLPALAPANRVAPAMSLAAMTAESIPQRMISRAAWGADEGLRSPDSPSYSNEIRFGVVHHTATGNDYARSESDDVVRSIYTYHTLGRGWWDIGYNFLIDKYGQVFEGRYGGTRRAVQGAHAGGFNGGSVGVALIGNHDQVGITSAARATLEDLLAWKFGVHGVDPHGTTVEVVGSPNNHWPEGTSVRLNNIIGHGDTKSTSCPGSRVEGMIDSGALADRVAAKLPPARAKVPPPLGSTLVTGDWDGDGREEPGWFKDGEWGLHTGYGGSSPTTLMLYGQAGDKPVVGDWDGDGVDTVGIVRGNLWILRSDYRRGADDVVMAYGRSSDKPVVGDWDGDGVDTLGVVRGNLWILRNEYVSGADDVVMAYGRSSDTPVTGDWDGDGVDTLGVVRGNLWILRSEYRRGADDIVLAYGRASDTPIVGNWNGDHRDTLGVRRGNVWIMRIQYVSGGDITYNY